MRRTRVVFYRAEATHFTNCRVTMEILKRDSSGMTGSLLARCLGDLGKRRSRMAPFIHRLLSIVVWIEAKLCYSRFEGLSDYSPDMAGLLFRSAWRRCMQMRCYRILNLLVYLCMFGWCVSVCVLGKASRLLWILVLPPVIGRAVVEHYVRCQLKCDLNVIAATGFSPRCLVCGYELAGGLKRRCPECGAIGKGAIGKGGGGGTERGKRGHH
jgi:hypothetical protein